MNETYFNHFELIGEAAHLSKDTAIAKEDHSLTVPDKLEEIIRHEAFYCRASEDEMPSRIVILGTSIASLISKGAYIDFECDPTPGPNKSIQGDVRHIPFSFPRLDEAEKITQVADEIHELSDDEFSILLSPLASTLLENQGESNGLSLEVNFIALTGLINYIGTSERGGLHFCIYTDADPS